MADRTVARPACGSREDAERFVAAFAGTMTRLEGVLAEETAHLAAGRIREGLAREAEKSELAAGYLQGLEHAKANAVALARFAPAAVAALRGAHERFRAAVVANQAVVATARAVSEGLVKSVADEVARQARPRGYGSASPVNAPARPLVFSARL